MWLSARNAFQSTASLAGGSGGTAPIGSNSESDKRQALRYPLELPVELPGGSGRSHDVSRSGVSFETDTPVSLESPIKFSLVLGQTSPDVPLRLDCEGEVVRVEPHDGGVSVAVRLTSCQ